MSEREQLERAILAFEAKRTILDDLAVETSSAVLH
jgi:hypothetical protein